MTVSDLKRIINDWPEYNSEGEPTEVWIGPDAGFSHSVRSIYPLDIKTDENGNKTADIILCDW